MKGKFSLAVIVCLFLILTAQAQNPLLINEAETQAISGENQLKILFAADNPNREFSAHIKLELIAPDDAIIAQNNYTQNLVHGRQIFPLSLSLDEKYLNSSDFIWYRLRYEITRPDNAQKTNGIISLSSILPENFDLRVAVPQVRGNMRYGVRVESFNTAKGNPVSGVELTGEITLENRQTIKGAARTDANGLALLEFDLPQISTSEDAEIKITGSKGGFRHKVKAELRIGGYETAYLQTDKAIYQPDQTLNLRLLYIDEISKPVTDAALTIEISEKEDDEIIHRQMLKTSRFGLSSLSWKIPAATKLGVYRIEVKNSENDVIGLEEIKITRYELPNFSVEAAADREYYLLRQNTARVEISAKYLFGKPVTRGKVRLVNDRNRFADEDEKTEEITGELNPDGKFTAEIDLTGVHRNFIPDKSKQFQDLGFTVYVTDAANNRTESKRFDIRISENPIHIYLISESRAHSSRLPTKHFVSTFYPDGTPAECEVSIYKKVEKEIGDETFTEPGEIIARTRTNSLGAGKFYLPVPFGDEDLEMLAAAQDVNGGRGKIDGEIEYEDEAAIQIETDKTLYGAGETVKVSLLSSEKDKKVFVDVLKKGEILQTRQIRLLGGRAEFEIPFQTDFQNHLTIAAYFENETDSEAVSAVRSVFFPSPQNLNIDAKTEKTVFRPGEDVSVKLRSRRGNGAFGETAFGVLVLDQALEERARVESEFDDNAQNLNRKFYSSMTSLFGLKKGFGNLTYRSLENLDMKKNVSAELQMAAEIALQETAYKVGFERSENLKNQVETIFNPYFRRQLVPVENALIKIFEEKGAYPKDAESLQKILLGEGIDFQNLRDPWGNLLHAEVRVRRDELILEIWSFGADKKPQTEDDLSVSQTSRRYFSPIGKTIDKTMLDYNQRTSFYITDYKTLRDETLKKGLNLDELRDAFGNPYIFDFSIDRTNYVVTIKSRGANGIAETENNADDFPLFYHRSDFYSVLRSNTIHALNTYVAEYKTFPEDESVFTEILKKAGFDLLQENDRLGRAFYVSRRENKRFKEVWRVSENILKAVRQKVSVFSINSTGADGVRGTIDDFEILSFTGITGEEEAEISRTKRAVKQKYISSPFGAVSGYLMDTNGAVIPGAKVEAKSGETGQVYKTVSDENGIYNFSNLPEGIYTLEFDSPGFQQTVISGVNVQPGVLLQIDIELYVAGVSSVVEVVSDSVMTINSTDTMLSTTITRTYITQPEQQKFTSRVRKYFPETLFWSPELISDAKGNADVKFKLADSLTTWKFYAVGSTETGEYGLVEKDLQTFQPFFVDLDPPRVLTEGDEISLPVTVRNYTEKRQKTNISMAQSDWFTPLNSPTQIIEIAPDEARNAIFDFRAERSVENAVQKVSAAAKGESDAVEKSVTVKPNGRETIEKQAAFFQSSTAFKVDFPANALAQGRRAELKIYPNMLAHVAESVEGLLERPHGCGEQTTSSTYPNLLILKIEKDLEKPIDENIKNRAAQNLSDGYKRLLNYQTDTGFGYWNGSSPDLALTAYVLRFLHDAKGFIEVDDRAVEKAEDWILSRQKADGSWTSYKGDADVSTAYIARSLALTAGNDAAKTKSLERAVEFLKNRLPEINDHYVLANLGLIAVKTGDFKTAEIVINKLTDTKNSSWTTANTPFNGWGTPAEIETTALVLYLLLEFKIQNSKFKIDENMISRGLFFLLKNKDEHGVWHSTQTTVNVLDTLILIQQQMTTKNRTTEKSEIFINGRKVREFTIDEKELKNPFVLDITQFLNPTENQIEIKGLSSTNPTMAHIVAAHYISWNDVPKTENEYYGYRVDFDKRQAKIGEDITCNVFVERKTYRRGMILLEIGLPPGADVDRESLETAKKEAELSSYDILPEKIVVYTWANSAPTSFNFKFKPRYALNAQNTRSIVYDYYNEEAKATIAPVKFEVK
ncbi:hypothetical protein BH20ACI4_BH20ACI4_13870 [soil metagenome]